MAWNTRPRPIPPKLIVLHWTAGEGNAARVRRTLEHRGLSVHYYIDQHGNLTQWEDPLKTVCLHAGRMNQRSVGVEIANVGTRATHPHWPRDRYRCRIQNRVLYPARFYHEQIEAVVGLVGALCRDLGIPRTLPTDPETSPVTLPVPKIRTVCLTPRALQTVSGVVGHFHVSPHKVDPGLDLLLALQQAWAEDALRSADSPPETPR
jgi:hypothetical protein